MNQVMIGEKTYNYSDLQDWETIKKGNQPWNKFMGLNTTTCRDTDNDELFTRLYCIKDVAGEYHTAGIQSKELFGSGYIEVKAKFNCGNSAWPAIWLFREGYANYDKKYYEIDIIEVFGNKPKPKTGLFMPKHIASKFRRLFRPKARVKINKNDWNTFSCHWNKDFISIFVNGKMVLRYLNNGKENSFPQTEEDRKFKLILSMQYCYGKPKPEQLPLWMDIKYVYYCPDVPNGF